MKKVLVLTYYWPPAGGSGVQRWLKFVKYFRDFGVEPIVYCPENPNYPITDSSLVEDIPEGITILRQPIKEWSRFLKKGTMKQVGFLKTKPSWKERILLYFRANFAIPDARSLWIKPSVAYLYEYLQSNPVDMIISTGPPHSMHLIAMQLKNKTNLQWLADFRDPWTDIDYFHHLPLSSRARNKHYMLESKVLKNADIVTVVSNQMREKYRQFNANTYLLYNGFDGETAKDSSNLDKKFSMVHVGLVNADRIPTNLFFVLGELIKDNPDFARNLELTFVGKIADEVAVSLRNFGLNENVKIVPYVPHKEVQKYQESAQLLLLLLNDVPASKGIVTGKVFEYFRAKRPILAIGPRDGDLDNLLRETKTGHLYDFGDKQRLKEGVLDAFNRYKKGELFSNSKKVSNFHRRSLTEELSMIIEKHGRS